MKKTIAIAIILVLCWSLFVRVVMSPQAEVGRASVAVSSPPQPTLPTPDEVEAAVNRFRVEQGLPTFTSDNAVLDQAAQVRAEGMCAVDDWSHDKAWLVLDQHYAYWLASENLYYGPLIDNLENRAVKVWRESPGHLENLLENHQEIGVGVKSCPGFQGSPNAVIITNYFGVPR